jgi:nucleoside-diphosphate-sugar epimerase
MNKKILVVGGCGYIGCELVKKLISLNYDVRVLDLLMYGKNLEDHKRLEIIKGDIRDINIVNKSLKDIDTVVHLACISNDPSFELNPTLGKSINLDSFKPFLDACNKNKIQRFVYASSSSVYGIKSEKNIHENVNKEPITDYSKYKSICEDILFNEETNFVKTIIRPATVCGYSKRLRLDLVVNLLTKTAYFENKIKIFGGRQLRPNIHIQDMVDAYILLIESDSNLVHKNIFNAGYENLSLDLIAEKIKKVLNKNLAVDKISTNDNRSYHISSNKIRETLNFIPSRTIEFAIEELLNIFKSGKLENPLENEFYYNIKRMKSLNLC